MKAKATLKKSIIAATAVAVALAVGSFGGASWWAHRAGMGVVSAHAGTVYACPMHPAVRMDHSGDCPICGMRLVRQGGREPAHAATTYACPMHPAVRMDHPGD